MANAPGGGERGPLDAIAGPVRSFSAKYFSVSREVAIRQWCGHVRQALTFEDILPNAGSRIRVSREAGVTVVTVYGEVDLTREAHLTKVLLRAVGASPAVLVDLDGCTFLDSSGLSALLSGVRAAKAAGVRFGVASAPGGAPRALFDLAFGHGLFASSDDRASGLAALRDGA